MGEKKKFDIKIQVPARDIEIRVICKDAGDAVILGGAIVANMRKVLGIAEPDVLVIP